MSTQIRNGQIKPATLEVDRLVADFLGGANLNITDGNEDATITGLQDGVDPSDAVTVRQLAVATAMNCDVEEFVVAADGETFTLGQTPVAGIKNQTVYLNGLRLASTEFAIAGDVVTVNTPTVEVGDCVIVEYNFMP